MTKLYVANVPLDATEDALRAHFAACGGVSDVELLHDRQSGRPRGLAHVTLRVGMDDETFRVEARSAVRGEADDAVIGVGGGATRREALADAMRAWNVASAAHAGRVVDGEAVARAMQGVRAI